MPIMICRASLVMLVALHAISQMASAGQAYFVANYYEKLGEPIEVERLAMVLSGLIKGRLIGLKGVHFNAPASYFVGEYIARARSNDRDAKLVGDISVRDLQEINVCKLDDCNKPELERRSALCKTLKDGLQDSANDSRWRLYYNLLDYCNYTVEHSFNWCADNHIELMDRALAKRLSGATKKHLIGFQRQIQRAGIPLGDSARSLGNVAIVKRALDDMDEVGRQKTMRACAELREITQEIYPFYDPKLKIYVQDYDNWVAIDYNCRQVGDKSVDLASGIQVEFSAEPPVESLGTNDLKPSGTYVKFIYSNKDKEDYRAQQAAAPFRRLFGTKKFEYYPSILARP